MIDWLAGKGFGRPEKQYKLRDWLFSRQRYWGEPFPIVYDDDGVAIALPDDQLPLTLPEVADYSPQSFDPQDATSEPVPPLARATEWAHVTLDLGDGPKTLPARAERHAAVGGFLLVRAAVPGPDERQDLLRPGCRAVLDGSRKEPVLRRERPRRGRPVRRRRRARGAAPAVLPVLAQGAVRPGPRHQRGAVPPAVQPGLHPGVRLHRRARCVRARRRGRRGPAQASSSTRASPSPRSTGRWASR